MLPRNERPGARHCHNQMTRGVWEIPKKVAHHTARLTIIRSSKVGIIDATSVLSVERDSIIS